MIQIYDTTLRDGAQRTDISLSFQDKLNIALRLDELGVAFIEGGWPGSNPKDAAFFERAREIEWKHATITAFGATCAANSTPEQDANLRALLEAGTRYCTVFMTDMDEAYRSWQKMLDASAQVIYPAHGRPFAAEKLRQNLGRIPNKALVKFF